MKMVGHNAQHLVPAVKHGRGVIIWTWHFRMGEKKRVKLLQSLKVLTASLRELCINKQESYESVI